MTGLIKFLLAFALLLVSMIQAICIDFESVQAMIFRKYKSIILVKYTKLALVQINVISVHHAALGADGLNRSF
jgi:hypothetical protein